MPRCPLAVCTSIDHLIQRPSLYTGETRVCEQFAIAKATPARLIYSVQLANFVQEEIVLQTYPRCFHYMSWLKKNLDCTAATAFSELMIMVN